MLRPGPIWLLAALGAFNAAMIAQTAPAAPGAQSPEGTAKAPYVLKTSTHLVLVDVIATNGKGEPAYQSFCHGLARTGYVVLQGGPIAVPQR